MVKTPHHLQMWLLTLSEDPTPDLLRACGVPEEQCHLGPWAPFATQSGATMTQASTLGRRLSDACPGVVFVGVDSRRPGDSRELRYSWRALPGPHTPTAQDVISSTKRKPSFDDGVRFPDSKVIVWVHRECDKDGPCFPLGYHVAAGTFDDSDFPGGKVLGWCPLKPQPSLRSVRSPSKRAAASRF